MRSKRMIFSVAAMLVAAVLALAACGGQENGQPQEEAQQQVLFDVTQFIGVDEAGLVAIMGEPDILHVNQSNNKEYTYRNITYTYNGEQGQFDHLIFFLRMADDGAYMVEYLGIHFDYSRDENVFFAIPANTDIFALFGINTDFTVSEELPKWKIENFDNITEGINNVQFLWNDKTNTQYFIIYATFDYS